MIVKIIKNIITGFVVLICLFVCLAGGVYYTSERDSFSYELDGAIAIGSVKSADAYYIGDTYLGKEQEGRSYYEVVIVFENTGNYRLDNYGPELRFVESGPGYTDMPAMNSGYYMGNSAANLRCVPAGKTGVLKRIIALQNDFENAKMIYTNEETNEELIFDLEITER